MRLPDHLMRPYNVVVHAGCSSLNDGSVCCVNSADATVPIVSVNTPTDGNNNLANALQVCRDAGARVPTWCT